MSTKSAGFGPSTPTRIPAITGPRMKLISSHAVSYPKALPTRPGVSRRLARADQRALAMAPTWGFAAPTTAAHTRISDRGAS